MTKIEKIIEKLDFKIQLCRDVFARKQLFITGFDVFDHDFGPFSLKKKYLFVAFQKNELDIFQQVITLNTQIIYGHNVTDSTFYFEHFNDVEAISSSLKLEYDFIILLKSDNRLNSLYFESGMQNLQDISFETLKTINKYRSGIINFNPCNRNMSKSERSKEKMVLMLKFFNSF